MLALFGLYVVSWKRVRNLPHALIRNPYVLFVVLAVFLSGLAFSVFANLGVLARQKSLLIPFMLLIPCLPKTIGKREERPSHDTPQAALEGSPARASPARSAPPQVSADGGARDDLDAFWA